jgi:hypothetical protein
MDMKTIEPSEILDALRERRATGPQLDALVRLYPLVAIQVYEQVLDEFLELLKPYPATFDAFRAVLAEHYGLPPTQRHSDDR